MCADDTSLDASHDGIDLSTGTYGSTSPKPAKAAPFITPEQEHEARATGFALLLYLLASFIVTFIGNFPVPVFGAGAGPVLGWYALLGIRATAASPSTGGAFESPSFTDERG